MTPAEKQKIEEISKEFASGFEPSIPLNGSGWLIADPLSGYLNFVGHTNTPSQLPATEKHPQVLVLDFPDGSQFIPAGGDLKPLDERFHNYMWL